MWRERTTRAASIAALCLLAHACGTPPTRGVPPETPLPGGPSVPTAPVSAGFLHVLNDQVLTTYEVDNRTGRLRAVSAQSTEDVHALTGEPEGRFVYMAYGPRSPRTGQEPAVIVAYLPDPQSGTLRAVSEASSHPVAWSGTLIYGVWTSLTASAHRIYGVWLTHTYRDYIYTYVTHPVDGQGQLGDAYEYEFPFGGSGGFADGRTDTFYRKGYSGVTAHFIDPKGELSQTGYGPLCGSTEAYSPSPIGSARGFLFARSYYPDYMSHRLCTFEGRRLAPRADLGFTASWVETFVPHDEAAAPLVALPATLPNGMPASPPELRLYSLQPSGDLRLLATVATTEAVTSALFHPMGRFLFASVGRSLEVYTFDADGNLAKADSVPEGAGRLAVTFADNR